MAQAEQEVGCTDDLPFQSWDYLDLVLDSLAQKPVPHQQWGQDDVAIGNKDVQLRTFW